MALLLRYATNLADGCHHLPEDGLLSIKRSASTPFVAAAKKFELK
jgi:hypothetical protein